MGSLCAPTQPLNYPLARRDDSVVDNYHGVAIPDPYQWLENPDSEETKEFVVKQCEVTDSVLKRCETREKLREKLTQLFDFPKYDVPFRAGDDNYFYFHNTGLQPQKVLYVVHNQDCLDAAKAEVLLDPNTWNEDGTVALKILGVSHDAKYLAYGTSSRGSDWVTVRVMTIHHKTVHPDTLSWVKFSDISWTKDGKGFFYSRYPAPNNDDRDEQNLDAGTETNVNLHHQLYYHFLGTHQSQDILCWKDSHNPKHMISASVTEDGNYAVVYICENCDPVNKVYVCDLSALPNGLQGYRGTNELLPFNKLVDNFDASYGFVTNDETVFTFRTNKNAPKYKLVRVDVKQPGTWYDVIQEDEKDVLESVVAVNNNQLVVNYLSDVKSVLQLRDIETGVLNQNLPIDIGTVCGISARRKDSTVFIGFTNFLIPLIIYQCDLQNKVKPPEMKIFREITVPGFDRASFNVTQVFVPSKDDGVKIPMFIVGIKDIPLDGSNPCLLFGYGGFSVSLSPYFSVARLVIAKHLGVVFCLANIRGGGEYGEEWHKAGALAKKQNCFDDFISASQYLIDAAFTNPSKLCIEGGSNGGLLIGACINQRPDLFGCALAHVGVMDMLRFHKFTIGHAWSSDFGCSDNEEEFNWLIKYSPLHNVRRPWEQTPCKALQYPSTMLLTADHDDRVVPLHTLKFLATMQHVLCTSMGNNSPQTNPIVGRIERNAGHGCGRPTHKLIDEAADRYAFMAKVLGAHWID